MMNRQATRLGLLFGCALTIFVPLGYAQRTLPPAPFVDTAMTVYDTPFTVRTHTAGRRSARPMRRPGMDRTRPVLPRTEEARWVFVNVHDDENTSVSAALAALRRGQARLVELVHTGGRNLVFYRGAERFEIDPNRMFTDAGAAASLTRLSGRSDSLAVREVRRFAEALLGKVGQARAVIALHNNTENNYSARSYLPGEVYASDAEAVHLQPGSDPDDFFFVTDRPLFDALRAEGFNVVLQNNATATDDGSLSVLAGRQGFRYVNVEAQHGHTREQQTMIGALLRVLGRLDTPAR